jgi:hypothetical protein
MAIENSMLETRETDAYPFKGQSNKEVVGEDSAAWCLCCLYTTRGRLSRHISILAEVS